MALDRPWTKLQLQELERAKAPASLPRPKPLYSLLTDAAAAHGGDVAMHYLGRDFTYSVTDQVSSRFAAALASLGVKRGDRVAIFLPNTPQFVFAFFGILKAGGIVVNNNPLYKERELERQLNDSGAEVIVASMDIVKGNDLYASLEGCRSRTGLRHVICTSTTDYLPGVKRRLAGLAGVRRIRRVNTLDFVSLVRENPSATEFAHVDPVQDVAVLQYTGGTTGVSKGAMLTHYNLYANAVVVARYFPLTQKDVCLAVLPLFHIFGLTAALASPFHAGSQVVLLPAFHVLDVARAIERKKVTCFCGVPSMYIAIVNHPRAKQFALGSVKACISGGSALPAEVRKWFNSLTGGNLVEGYGLSETSPVTHCNPFLQQKGRAGSIGIPLVDTDARIVSTEDRLRVLGIGEVGELAVKGPQVMKGYWRNDEETALVLHDGWLLTGDIARMDGDGFFYIVDRKKDMVDVGGMKVYPRDVEEVLFEIPGVREAAIIGVPDSFTGESVKAFVVLKDGVRGVSEEDVKEFCAARLVKYKVPKSVVFVPDLPKSLIGKVLRRQLRENSLQS